VLAFDTSIEFALKARNAPGWGGFAQTLNSLSPKFLVHLEHTAEFESIARAELELTLSRVMGRTQTLALGAQFRQGEQLMPSFFGALSRVARGWQRSLAHRAGLGGFRWNSSGTSARGRCSFKLRSARV
jgi:hypothetical protein